MKVADFSGEYLASILWADAPAARSWTSNLVYSLGHSSTLKIKATSGEFQRTTRRYIPEDKKYSYPSL
jgi:hypothetical protein